MFLVGLTGGIASGKSTVACMLRDLNVQVIDADQIARDVVQPGTTAWRKILREFGPEVILEDGQIDRPRLGRIIFSDSAKRKLLNSITHPEIYRVIGWKCLRLLLSGYQFVVIDVPLLYETRGLLPYMTKVIVVSCRPEQQLQRLMRRNDLGEEEASSRIGAQLPLSEKCAMADFVVDNAKDVDDTRRQVEHVLSQLRGSYAHWRLRSCILMALMGIVVCCVWAAWGLSSFRSGRWG